MIDLQPYKYFYFLGIGGIGMSALARYFNSKSFEVAGYDRTATALTNDLGEEGMHIHFQDDVAAIPAHFLKNKEALLVVYTPAIPKDHKEYNYLADNGFTLKKRAEVLASVTQGNYTIAVAGTHGKTSTASIIAHILKTGGIQFYAFLGGIATNYGTNFLAPDPGQEAELMVVEADEYDRSFLQLKPDIAIITAIESDHLDIYGNDENLRQAFVDFGNRIEKDGALIANEAVDFPKPEMAKFEIYGTSDKALFKMENVKIEDDKYHFDFISIEWNFRINDLILGIPGMHNVENSVAAIGATEYLFEDKEIYYEALATFRGVHRRFEMIYNDNDVVYVDDYAHHPTEIRVTLQTVRDLYPGKKILAIFQPHLFSRTRDLAKGFGESLSLADELVLLPIYPARELPMPGVTSELILNEVHSPKKQIVEKENVLAYLGRPHNTVIVTIGAGDIDRLVQPIKNMLENR